jgi:hypothetical protein
MSKYTVEIELTKKEYIEVNASSEKEAKEKAFKEFYSMVGNLDEDVRCLSIDNDDERD